MKYRLLKALALAGLLASVISAVVTAQRITSLTANAKGQGTVTISDVDKHQITSVLVILRENGEADITLIADMQISGQGTWSVGEDLSKGIDLKITGGVVSGNATGTGKLFLRDDRKSIAKLTITATAADESKVRVEFTAEETAKTAKDGQPM